jgi:hypothetical protein
MKHLPAHSLNLLLVFALSAAFPSRLQARTPDPTRAQTKAANAAKIAQLLAQSGYTFRKASDDVWVVNGHGKNIGDFGILVAADVNYALLGVVVAKKNQMNMTFDLTFKLLRLAHSIDYVKVGLDDDQDLFVRTEIRTRLFDLQSLKDTIEDVSTAADKAYVEVKPFLSKP